MSFKFVFKLMLFSFLITGSISCGKDRLSGDMVVDDALLQQLNSQSVDTLKFDNQKLILETYLFRDFFPGVVPNKRRLFASFNVINTDSLPISGRLEIETLYIVNKDQIWVSNPVRDTRLPIPTYKAYRISRDGPEWETGIYVDAIVSVKDLQTSVVYYLAAREQLIERLD